MKKHGLAFVLLGMTLVGCGSSPQQDASNLMAGVGGGASSTGTSSALVASDASEASPNVIQEIHNHMVGAAWLGVVQADGKDTSNNPRVSGSTPFTTCPTLPQGTTGCTSTCATTSSWTYACSSTASTSATCNGTKYTMSNPNYSVTLDTTNVTGTGSSASGSISLAMSFSGNVSGGSFDGKVLSCKMNFSLDIAKMKAGTATFTPTCDTNFSCSYNGSALSCADISSKMASAKTSCS